MDKVFYKSTDILEGKFKLEYYLLTNHYTASEEGICLECYGVEVQKIHEEDGVEYIQSKTIYDICCSERKITELLEILCSYTVTPITLYDIVNDMVDDGFFDESLLLEQVA